MTYCKNAIISMILGISCMVIYFVPLPFDVFQASLVGFLLGVSAVFVSQKARREIQIQPTLKGLKFAFIGRTLGVIGIVFGILAAVVWFLRVLPKLMIK